MIMLVAAFLVTFFSHCALGPVGQIVIPTNRYTNGDTLADYGGMAYQPITILLNNSPYVLRVCNSALNNRNWWKTRFAPQHLIYMQSLLAIDNAQIPSNAIRDQKTGSLCLFIMSWQLQKLFKSLSCTTDYLTTMARQHVYNEHDPVHRQYLPQILSSSALFDIDDHLQRTKSIYNEGFDELFFVELKEEISVFDNAVIALAEKRNNQSIAQAPEYFKEFMVQFERLIVDNHNRQSQTNYSSQLPSRWGLLFAWLFDALLNKLGLD